MEIPIMVLASRNLGIIQIEPDHSRGRPGLETALKSRNGANLNTAPRKATPTRVKTRDEFIIYE